MNSIKHWAALLAAAALIAGCGSSDDTETTAPDGSDTTAAPATIADIDVETGPFESEEEFVDAVDDFCGQAQAIYDRTPVYGVSAAGLEAEFEHLLRLEQEDLAKTESIEAPEELADAWAAYNEASAELNAVHEKVLAAAGDGDAEKANALLGDAVPVIDSLAKASDDAGVECVDMERPLSDNEPAPAAEAADAAPQPSNTVEEAADAFLETFQSGDCKEIEGEIHTQMRLDAETIADPGTGDCSPVGKTYTEAEVPGTSQWGPVATVAVEVGPGQFEYLPAVLDPDKGGELKHVGRVYADPNGLDAPNEGIDADATAQAFVDAVRANDAEALNETLTVESLPAAEGGFQQDGPFEELGDDPEYAEAIVTDIRADEEATPELLGVNQLYAAYLLDTEEGNDYILTLGHEPGSETAYRVNAYWALPAEG